METLEPESLLVTFQIIDTITYVSRNFVNLQSSYFICFLMQNHFSYSSWCIIYAPVFKFFISNSNFFTVQSQFIEKDQDDNNDDGDDDKVN